MDSPKTTIVFVPGPIAEYKEAVECITKELQNRGISDICVLTGDDLGVHKTPAEQAQAVIKALEAKKCIPSKQKDDEVYSEEDEAKIKKRLEDLGYL
jgi:5,10-methylenetetrahydrofolate reductase